MPSSRRRRGVIRDVDVSAGSCDEWRRLDPYEYVLSANIHRRHLTAEQKREIIAKVLKAQPEKSNRTIAKQMKVDHKTVGSGARASWRDVRKFPTSTTVTDTKGRKQPTKKSAAPPRTCRREGACESTRRRLSPIAPSNIPADAAHRRAGAESAESVTLPKQSDIEHVLPTPTGW